MSPADELRAATDAIADALNTRPGDWRLRDEGTEDEAFVADLYTSTRWEELAEVPWPDAAKREFLHAQSRLQSDHYRKNYPGAVLALIERDAVPVGRVYLYASPGEFRLMDIALLPDLRGHGLGERMLRALMQCAAGQGRSITLHVEPNNPAQHLYARLGFAQVEQRGVYQYLVWSPAL